jgi:hypothetical protein
LISRDVESFRWGVEERVFPILFRDEIEQRTYTEILGEKIRFTINGKVHQVEHIPTENEIKDQERHTWMRPPKWDFVPSGVLSLVIENWLPRGLRKTWSDGKSKGLEEMLNDFVVGAIKVADSLKQDRLEREERQRLWQEELRKREEIERQRLLEEKRLHMLEQQADLWTKSEKIRAFVSAVEGTAAAKGPAEINLDDLNRWVSWAREHADRMDPLKGKLPF